MDTKHTAAQPLDLDKLEALALAYVYEDGDYWYSEGQLSDGITYEPAVNFIVAALPSTILELIAQARTARLDTTASASGDERALFERLVKGTDVNLERGFGDEYRWMNTAKMFSGFKLGRATLAPVAAQQASDAQTDEQTMLHLSRELITALKRLSFAAQTSGGTAGPDAELQAAVAQAEQALSLGAVARAMDAAAQQPAARVAVPDEVQTAMGMLKAFRKGECSFPSSMFDIVAHFFDGLAASPATVTAPKDTPVSMAASNARFAIDGAIQFGRENRNPPPSTDHWLYEYWNIGRQLAKLGETGWDNVTPLATANASERCPHCDDTGDVHSLTGEWRGTCTCPAGATVTAPAQHGDLMSRIGYALFVMSKRKISDENKLDVSATLHLCSDALAAKENK